MNEQDKLIFETCSKLKDNGLYQFRRPNSYYYVTPKIVIRMDEMSDLRSAYNHFSEFEFTDLILQPTLEELLESVQITQIIKLVGGGYVAYQDNSEGASFKTQGDTIWLAIANLFNHIQEYNKSLIPNVDTNTLDESNSKPL